MSSEATLSSRFRLPQRRESTLVDLFWGNERYHVAYSSLGGRILEVFIQGPRAGTDMYAICCTASVVISIALQHGTPLKTLADAVLRDPMGNPVDIVGVTLDFLVAESKAGA